MPNMKTNLGTDGFDYPFTSPKLVINADGKTLEELLDNKVSIPNDGTEGFVPVLKSDKSVEWGKAVVSYNDLTDKPTIPTANDYAEKEEFEVVSDKVTDLEQNAISINRIEIPSITIKTSLVDTVNELKESLTDIAYPNFTNLLDKTNPELQWMNNKGYDTTTKGFVEKLGWSCNQKKVHLTTGDYYVFSEGEVEFELLCFNDDEYVKTLEVTNNIITVDGDYDIICNTHTITGRMNLVSKADDIKLRSGYNADKINIDFENINGVAKDTSPKTQINWISGIHSESENSVYTYSPQYITTQSLVHFDEPFDIICPDYLEVELVSFYDGHYIGTRRWLKKCYLSNVNKVKYYINIRNTDSTKFFDNIYSALKDIQFINLSEPYSSKYMFVSEPNGIFTLDADSNMIVSNTIKPKEDLLIYCYNPQLDYRFQFFNDDFEVAMDTGFLNKEYVVLPKNIYNRIMVKNHNNTIPILSTSDITGLTIKEYSYDKDITNDDRYAGLTNPYTYFNGLGVIHEIEENKVLITDVDEYAHQSSMAIKDSKAYIVNIANTTTYKADDENVFIKMTVFNISTKLVESTYTVAQKGTYGALNLQGICGNPTITANGDTMEIVFYSTVNGFATLLHRSFNTTTNVFSDVSVCKYKVKNEIHDFNLNNIIDSFRITAPITNLELDLGFCNFCAYMGKYIGVAWSNINELDGIMFITEDFINYFYVNMSEYRTNACGEISSYIFNGCYYLAYRKSKEDMSMLVEKYDINTLDHLEYIVIPDCSMRPCFYEYDGSLYLAHAPISKDNISILKIDESSLDNIKQVFNIDNCTLDTLWIVPSDTSAFVCYTDRSTNYDGIYISSFNPEQHYSKSDINTALYNLIN